MECLDKEILNCAHENLINHHYKEYNYIPKRSIFSPLVELFNGSTYLPSKFVDKNLDDFAPLNSPEVQLDSDKHISELNRRIENYERLVSDLMEIIESKPKPKP